MYDNYDYTNYDAYSEQYDVRQPQYFDQQDCFRRGFRQGYRQGFRDGRRTCQYYGYPGYTQSPFNFDQTSYPY